MRSLFLVVTLCFYCCSCQNEGVHSHLSRQKMQLLLEDIHLAEAYSRIVSEDSTATSREKNYDSLARYYQIIFSHYNITDKEFEQSLDWYKKHPEELDSTYGGIIDNLEGSATKYPVPKS